MTKKEINKGREDRPNGYFKLSIQVSLNGLSFCVLDTIANSLVLTHVRRFEKEISPFELHKVIRADFEEKGVLDYSYSEVISIHRNTLFALVPMPLFDPEQLPNYLKYNAKILGTDHLDYDPIQGLDSANVYVPFTNVNNYLFDQFGEFEFKHSGTVLLETLLKLPSSRQGTLAYLHLAESQMDLAVFSNKKLLFYNSFIFSSPEDIMYFLLFALEQLELDLDILKLRLLGEVTEGDRIYELCTEYLENVSFFIPPDTSFSTMAEGDGIDFTLISAL
ncbi:DUF3822 family protein [Robiginitalea aurantiaca]|uniref:DUF3822 family protein n=1 Tax=Robiginitalea aurantiaca TaxID=3056915 RepID=A0ABT7WHQ6_9FLAO|nr:DUF3822 family protein [Robiginitalea aurantiaca]MDM9632457.1 DUF3822 family protein [Robiginitalea aurantiaca]